MVFNLNLWPILQQSVNTGCLQGEVGSLPRLMINPDGNIILWCSSLLQLLAHIEASDFVSIKSDNTGHLFHVPISHGLKLRLVFSFFILTQTVTFHNRAHASQVKQMLRRCVRRCVGGLAGSRGVSESGGRKNLSKKKC